MNSDDYDTAEGLDRTIQTLSDIHDVRHERHKAGYERHENLNEFIVLGRFWMDTCGNFMPCTFDHYDGQKKYDADWLHNSLPKVVTLDQVKITGVSITGNMDTNLPKPGDKCEECGDEWTLENCHDVTPYRHENNIKRHKYCAYVALVHKAFIEYTDMLVRAGMAKCPLIPIQNEYWNEPQSEPWFLIRTPRGDIKIGWRKSVINIDWKDIVERKVTAVRHDPVGLSDYNKRRDIHNAFRAEVIFPSVTSTKGDYYVHAHGTEKAIEYLKVLATLFRIGERH